MLAIGLNRFSLKKLGSKGVIQAFEVRLIFGSQLQKIHK
jgi:hypothetical protein